MGMHSSERLQAVKRIPWIYVGHLDPITPTDNVMAFIRENKTDVKNCEELHSRGRNKAFKIGIFYESHQIADDPSFWPEGTVFAPFVSDKSSDGSTTMTQATPMQLNKGLQKVP
jgi:hypothetical protein